MNGTEQARFRLPLQSITDVSGMSPPRIINIAVPQNARGGPGIVMASVAFDAAIINAPFFTTLVLTAVLTSQLCGFWLDFVLRKGWPLLSGDDLRKRGIDPPAEEEQPVPETPRLTGVGADSSRQ